MAVPRPSGVRRILARLRRPPLVPTLLALVALLAGGLYALPLRSGPAAVPLQLEGGEVVVYGPKRVESPTGGTVYQVEKFTLALQPGARYTLRVQNGAADGSARLDSARVVLNGSTVLTGRELHRGAASASRVIEANGSNTVEVRATGVSGTFLTLSVVQEPDPTYTVFGPKTYVRETGAPVTLTEQFTLQPGAGGPYRLHVVNGNPDGTQRLASAQVRLNGVNVLTSSDLNQQVGGLVREVPLQAQNTVEVTVEAKPSGRMTIRFTASDTTAPVLTVTAPAAGLVTRAAEVAVAGSVRDETATQVSVNGTAATMNGNAFSATVPLAQEGRNTLVIRATDAAGHRTDSTRVVIRDTQAPVLSLTSPAEGMVTREGTVQVQGTVADTTAVTVNVNGVALAVGAGGGFSGSVPLTEGTNFLTVSATDQAGNSVNVARQVVLDSQAPVLTVSAPAEGENTSAESIQVTGVVQDATAVTLTVNGTAVTVGAGGAFTHTAALVQGANTITVAAADAVGNGATVARTVTREDDDVGLPPDPARVAPAIDATVATSLGVSTAFLYTGSDPIQTGVAPGTIVPHRAAVLRGRVVTREGAPLSGVRVSVHGRPELGQTLSRRDGAYDLAVNGGGTATLDFEKDGYLPAQRGIGTAWMEFAGLDDVALVPLDSRVTAVALTAATAEAQVARGSVTTDADGPRQATVLFSPGTEAVLELPDGTTRPVGSLAIRLTEYTVGAGGRAAMPGELPGTSGYTYAVELSADEAIAAGAEHVRFSKPVKFYVENFLEFPVGGIVPVAYYDRGKAAWVPMDNGRIIRVLPGGGELAQVDANGDGAADGEAALGALGIEAVERAELARTYPQGAALWRVQTTHFSPLDLNYPVGMPFAPPPPNIPRPLPPEECSGRRSGSIIECESRTLGERITVAGTGLTLNYRSDRASGRAYETVIPITGESVDSLRGVVVDVWVAGRHFQRRFDPAPRLNWTFHWDGLDAYGRRPQGAQTIRVRRSYSYQNFYLFPSETARSFGLTCRQTGGSDGMLPCIIPATLNERVRQDGFHASEYTLQVTQWDGRMSVAGWSLSDHHVYDPSTRRLYMGTGERRTANQIGRTIETIAGSGVDRYSGSGGRALEAALQDVGPIAVASDGTVYVAGWELFWLARITRDGRVEHVAGGDRNTRCAAPPCGDGGPVSKATFRWGIEDLKFGPDGSLYIVDGVQIRKVAPDGIIASVAGDWSDLTFPYPGDGGRGDGGPAVETAIGGSWAVAADREGSVYFAEEGEVSTRIRKVSPDGIIHTVAGGIPYPGTDSAPCRAEGIAATSACLARSTDIDVAPDGTLYILEPNNRLVKVTPDGILHRVAGGGARTCWVARDGVPALETGLCSWRMELDREGRIYYTDSGGPALPGTPAGEYRLRMIDLNGIVTTIVGGNGWCRYTQDSRCGDGGLARRASIGDRPGFSFGPDGAIYLGDKDVHRVRRVRPPYPAFGDDATLIASIDGDEVYEMDGVGRHLRTLDARTRAVRRAFAYNAAGRLTSITDGDGQTTRVERDGAGRVQALVSSGGERTVLEENAQGYLAAVTNPAGDKVQLEYSGEGGLLLALTDPRGGRHQYAYDALGRLERDTDATEGFQALEGFTARNCTTPDKCEEGIGARVRTALGRTTTYWSQSLAVGGVLREVSSPTGLVWSTTTEDRGWTAMRSPDGMSVTSLVGSDPRFGMDIPFSARTEIRTPGGLRLLATQARREVRGNLADPLSLTTQVDSLVVNGRATVTTYEAVSRRTTVVTPAGRHSVVVHDSLGRPVEVRAPGGFPIHMLRNARGLMREMRQGDRVWSYDYDERGLLRSFRNPLGNKTFTYDAAGRVIGSVLPGGREVAYVYDAAGNAVGVRPPGRGMHAFAFDSAGRLSAYTPPEVEGVSKETRYRYDAEGQVVQVLRPEGDEVTYAYDGEGRTEEVRFSGATVRYGYDPATGQLRSASSNTRGSLAFTYDGSLPVSTTWSGLVEGSVSHGFNNDFRVVSQRVNGAHEVDYRYDADGLLVGVGALTLTRSTESGRLTGSQAGGVSTSLVYDSLSQVAEIASRFGTQTLYQARHQRDAAGRVQRMSESFGADSTVYVYGYDAAGRLATVHRNGVAQAAYEYDANGNRLRVVTAGGVLDAEYDGQDRLRRLGETRFGYTAGGDLAFRAVGTDTTRYTYDAFGNLTNVRLPGGTRVEYLVDPASRRVGKRVDGALVQGFLYATGVNPVAELDGQGRVVSRFVYGSMPNVPDLMIRDGITYRLVTDQLGSVREVVNAATGEVVQRMDFDAYGAVTIDTRPGFQPFGFAGGLSDAQVGLVRFGARDYDPRAGRWTTRDPIGFAGGDANLYGYVHGDPVNLVDPVGKWAFIPAALTALYQAAEAGLSAADVAETVQTLRDPCATAWDKFKSAGLTAAGVALPGAGYNKVDDVDVTALRQLTNEASNRGRKPVSADEVNTLLDWAVELGIPIGASKTDLATPSNWKANPVPHVHIRRRGFPNHIPVLPGIQPRT